MWLSCKFKRAPLGFDNDVSPPVRSDAGGPQTRLDMARHDRLLQILMLLKLRRRVSVETLASECGVSTRTIYRDLGTITKANYPLYYHNGYRLLPHASLPPLCLTPDELEVLRAALGKPLEAADTKSRDVLRRIQLKLEALLRPRQAPHSDKFHQTREI